MLSGKHAEVLDYTRRSLPVAWNRLMPRSVMADGIIVIQVEEGGASCISSIIRKRAGEPMMADGPSTLSQRIACRRL